MNISFNRMFLLIKNDLLLNKNAIVLIAASISIILIFIGIVFPSVIASSTFQDHVYLPFCHLLSKHQG